MLFTILIWNIDLELSQTENQLEINWIVERRLSLEMEGKMLSMWDLMWKGN